MLQVTWTVSCNLYKIIPVPQPLCGAILIAGDQILYHHKRNVKELLSLAVKVSVLDPTQTSELYFTNKPLVKFT
jgi:hypothetical protein